MREKFAEMTERCESLLGGLVVLLRVSPAGPPQRGAGEVWAATEPGKPGGASLPGKIWPR